ncbi:hypothetical protein QYF61_006800 [Mycteria americana]|uniref:DUF4657 domain-containing protein n=1 Tax=Mycteria americana TaxID=33587 RepID=A0AAN7MK40_MYCAM|nr:hypothetical protein QYF61_006800 [Mycteria americana]
MAGAAVGWLEGLGRVAGQRLGTWGWRVPCPASARGPPPLTPPGLPRPADGPWETAESCVVRTSASVYRRLQETPRQPPGGMSTWGPPPPPHLSPGTPPASGRLLKSESEDSGVEMASNEHSPSTPLGSESSLSLDGFPPEKSPPGEEQGTEPPRPPRSCLASKKLVQAAQRSRRQRVPGRCPRQLGRRSASAADLRAESVRDPQEPEEPSVEDPEGAVRAGERVAAARGARMPGSPRALAGPQAVPDTALPAPGQGLRYLEHVCQMLERLAQLQQDNRLLRQQAADAQRARPDTTVRAGRTWGARGRGGVGVVGSPSSRPASPCPQPTRELPGQDGAVWRGERFRPRSCSDSQAPAPDLGPCRRMWGHSASSPSLLDPSESGTGTATPDKEGRSPWGRVKVLLTRLTRRSLRGGRCRTSLLSPPLRAELLLQRDPSRILVADPKEDAEAAPDDADSAFRAQGSLEECEASCQPKAEKGPSLPPSPEEPVMVRLSRGAECGDAGRCCSGIFGYKVLLALVEKEELPETWNLEPRKGCRNGGGGG